VVTVSGDYLENVRSAYLLWVQARLNSRLWAEIGRLIGRAPFKDGER
jgi:hypothetical protein